MLVSIRCAFADAVASTSHPTPTQHVRPFAPDETTTPPGFLSHHPSTTKRKPTELAAWYPSARLPAWARMSGTQNQFSLTRAASMRRRGATKWWQTFYELSGFRKTPRYAETIASCKRRAAGCPWIKYESFGTSPQGRELRLVIVSRDRAFTPSTARKTGKAIILIQSGIHAGEIDGKDTSLMLIHDMAITKSLRHLLDHTILLFVPISNVDGHERFGAYNRINQNGPDEMGWRVTAQNLNLKREHAPGSAG